MSNKLVIRHSSLEMRYLKLFFTFMKSSVQMELEYRANFLTQVCLSLLWIGVTLVSVLVFYTHTDAVGGWALNEALVIVGMFTFMGGVIQTLLQPNAQKIVEMIRTGTMDFVLTKPVNSQFIATLRHHKIFSSLDMLVGAGIVLVAFGRMGYAPSSVALLQFALMLALALLTLYSIWVIMATISFWFVKVANLTEGFNAIWDTGRFPVTTFDGVLRIALTFVLPIAFITTFPAQAILGKLDGVTMIPALIIGVGLFAFSAWFWRYAVRSYSSASS
jgi:ABC-2 type transport system permease protein